MVFACTIFLNASTQAQDQTQNLKLTVDGGVSKIVGEEFAKWNWGFNVGGYGLIGLNDFVLLGIRVAYNRWTPDEEEFGTEVENLVDPEVDGESWTLEILPTLRISTASNFGVNLFAQGGAGLYLISNETSVTGTDTVGSGLIRENFGEDARGRFGFMAGAGLSFGNLRFASIDLIPTYHHVFLDGNDLQYFELNLGISLGI